jgi:predicted ATPase/DNA-binding winged helix-turn-helix (wHTH) protein/class 3 adenylate cyclase
MRYSFGDYVLDTQRYELHHAGEPIKLRRKVFQVLAYLLVHRDRVVPKSELLAQLWPEQFVGEEALTSCVKTLRRALGERGRTARFVRTLHGQGYRFVAAVEEREHRPADESPPALPLSGGAGATRQAAGPAPVLAAPLADPGTPLTDPGTPPWEAPDRGRYVATSVIPHFPSPLMGEGSGGGESHATSSPHRNLPPPGGKGPLPTLVSWVALDGEHKQVTILCGSLAEASTLAARLGPEAMYHLMLDVLSLAQDTVQRYAGTLTQVTGDGFLALFGAPMALEDHARRAVLAALELCQRLREPHAIRGQPHGVAVCLALHTGPVVVGPLAYDSQRPYTAAGGTLHVATRLQRRAVPDTLLVSAATYALVQGEVQGEVCETCARDAPSTPGLVYVIRGLLRRRAGVPWRGTRPLSRLVGRTQELALLAELFEHVEGGQGQVVGIVAEAGGGKSRLLYEFGQRLAGKRVTYLAGRCLSYGQAMPYHPIIDLLCANCGITEADSPAAIAGKVRMGLQELGMDVEASAPYLLRLLGVKEGAERLVGFTPEAIKARTFETLRQMSLHGSQRRPLVCEIEDLHWCDNTSADYLAWLVESVAGAAILLLVTYRPGYRPSWLDKSYATQMALRNLAPQDSITVVRSTCQHHELPGHLEQMIIGKAEGNPFFLEELTRAVLDHADVGTDVSVPETIQGVLTARIDRLPEAPKRLLQTAAVLGREVSPPLLEAIWDGPRPLESLLLTLTRQEFLFARPGPEGAVYVFKHALTQEVAYEGLLTTRRRALHAAAGQALETLYAPRLEEAYERLAYHYARTDNVAKAVAFLTRVAEKAARHSAHVEAISHLTQALELLQTLPATPEHSQQELTLRIALGASLIATKGYAAPEVEQTYARARQLCRHLDDPHQLFPALHGLRNYYQVRAEYQTSRALGEQLLTLAQQAQDSAMLLVAHRALGTTLLLLGAAASAHMHLAQGMALYDPQRHRTSAFLYGEEAGMICFSRAAWTLWWLGYPEQGLARNDDAVILAQQSAHSFSLGFALTSAAVFHQCRREGRTARERAEAAIILATEQGFPFWRAFGLMLHGWALAHQGQAQEGLELIQQGLMSWRATGAEQLRPYFLALLADAYMAIGSPAAGLMAITEALTLVDNTGERWYEPELHRLKGELLLQQSADHHAEAQACFQQALDLARSLQAKSLELRAATSLARLWQQQGKCAEAYQLLAEVYGWFTEGFDTVDLQEAKALLEELA